MLTEAVESRSVVESGSPARVRGVFERLPDLVGPATAGFSVPAMALLLGGFYEIPLVILLGCLGALAVVVAVMRADPEPARPRDRAWTLAGLVLAVVFLAGNAGHTAQRVDSTGPPGVHALTGQWLVHHRGPAVPLSADVFAADTAGDTAGHGAVGADPGAMPQTPGLRPDPEHPGAALPAAGHLVPALLGVTGWFAGPVGMFGTNALLGGLALLAVFGLLRRFAGRCFALLASAALGLSLPMVAAARDTGTAPLLLLLVAGAGSMLWRAGQTRRPVHFAVAGLTACSAAMTGAGGMAAALVLVVVAAAVAVGRGPGGRARVGLLAAGCAVPAGLAWLDLTRESGSLVAGARDQVSGLLGVLDVPGHVLPVALAGVGALVAHLLYRFGRRGRWSRRLAVGAGLVMVAVPGVLTAPLVAARPVLPHLPQVLAACAALPDDAAVVTIGDSAAGSYAQAMRAYCNVPSYPMPAARPGALGRLRAGVARHGRRLYAVGTAAASLPRSADGRPVPPLLVVRASVWPQPLPVAPGSPVARSDSVYLALVGPGGTAEPVPRVANPVPAPAGSGAPLPPAVGSTGP